MSIELAAALEETCGGAQVYSPYKKQYVLIGLDANAGLVPTDMEDGTSGAWATTRCAGDANNERC
eukprot:12930182-Prorocentrum_lima.AAC.1